MRKLIISLVAMLAIIVSCDPTPGVSYGTGYPRPAAFTTMASQAGWPKAQQPRVACLIARESGWNPKAVNPHDPGYGSYGWLQINMSKGRYGTWAFYRGMLGNNIFNLFNPRVNLTVGRDLFLRSGRIYGDPWRPWRPLGGC
jgi:hypothetical protein